MTTAGTIVSQQFQSGTLKEDNKKRLVDLAKSEIQKAGGDRQAGILSAQNLLQGTSGLSPVTTPKTPTTPTGQVETKGLEKAKGYDESQVGIPGVNLFTPDKQAPARDEDPLIQPIKITGEQIQQQPDEPTEIGKIDGRDWELGQAELDIYNTLSKEQQQEFWLTRDQLAKNQTDYAKDLADFLGKAKSDREYLEGRQEKKTQIDSLTGEIQEIQSSARIKQAHQQVQNLKQNLAYIGTMGRPGVSSQRLDAVDRQISDAEQTYSDMVTIENKLKEIRELGLEIDTEAFEKQMEDLQNSLDDQINRNIQEAYNSLVSADQNGKLDTIEEIEAFKNEVLANMDKEIVGITDKNFQERKFLIDQANLNIQNTQKQIADYQKQFQEFQKNANTVNLQMSQAQGFYVDGNGNPIISATSGGMINIPETPPMPPVFDKNSGQLIQFATDENGNIFATVDQVIDQPTFAQETINSVLQAIQNGTMTPQQANSMFPQLTQTEQFMRGLGQIRPQAPSTGIGTSAGGISGGFQDLTNVLQRPAGSKNVGQDTNNPGNIMAESPQGIEYAKSLGAIGFYKSPNGRTYAVFPDMETGLEATKKDIASKLSGGSRWVTQSTTLGELAHGWTSGPNDPNINENAIKNFERLTGVNRNTPISQIPQETLIDAIVKNEGVDISKGADLSYLAQQTQQEYSTNEKAIMDAYLKNPTSKQNIDAMNSIGLTSADLDNYTGRDLQSDLTQYNLSPEIIENIEKSQLYKNLSQENREIAKGLLSYSQSLPPRNAQFNAITGAVRQIDPTWNAAKYEEKRKFKDVWNKSTIQGGSLSKAATTLQLAAQLEDIYKDLKGQSRLQALNSFVNMANRELGNVGITNFDIARDLLVKEMAGAFKGTASPTDSDIKTMNELLSGKLTPKQTQNAIDLASAGLFKRINSEALSYENIMGEKPDSIFDADTYRWMQDKGLKVDEYFAEPRGFTPDGTPGVTEGPVNQSFQNAPIKDIKANFLNY